MATIKTGRSRKSSSGKTKTRIIVHRVKEPCEHKLRKKIITENGVVTPDDSYEGFSEVEVNVPSKTPRLQTKTVTANGTVTPDSGYDGLSKVTVNVKSDNETLYAYRNNDTKTTIYLTTLIPAGKPSNYYNNICGYLSYIIILGKNNYGLFFSIMNGNSSSAYATWKYDSSKDALTCSGNYYTQYNDIVFTRAPNYDY